MSSSAIVAATVVQTGSRDAAKNPRTIARMSQVEFSTLSP